MTITRRTFMITGTSALVACGKAGPGAINVSATMTAGANPGPDGTDRPLTLTLVSLNATDAFDSADVFSLQDPETALGSTLIRSDQLALAPNGTGALAIPVIAGATTFGVVAGFRDVSGKAFRATVAIPPSGDLPVNITVSPAGLSVTS